MRRRTCLPLAAVCLVACSGHTFLDERVAMPYAAHLGYGDRALRTASWVLASPPGAPPLRVAVEHVGARQEPAVGVLALVPGVFSSRATWRFLLGPLGGHYDLLLVDPPGTGGSDKPPPRAGPPAAYTPAWSAMHVMRALEAWSLHHADARPLVLVGHSLGAALVLRMLSEPDVARQAPVLLSRVRGLVLISPPDVVVEGVPPTLESPGTVSGVEIDLARVVGLFSAGVEDGVWEAQYDPSRSALAREVATLERILGATDTRCASQAMLERYNPTGPDGRLDEARVAVLRASLGRVHVPVLAICGEADTTLPLENGRRVVAGLPCARLVVVPRTRHSPHIERPAEVAGAILRFAGYCVPAGRGTGP